MAGILAAPDATTRRSDGDNGDGGRVDCRAMTVWEALAITAAGFVAGGVNTVVGSGSLVTFPVLVALGYPSVTANVSNTIGLVPGSVSGAIGYRRELRGQARRCAILAAGTVVGALIGGVLLLSLPSSVFDAVVPVLILLAVALMALRPAPQPHGARRDRLGLGLVGTFFTGIYGGYFGAAQGIILLAILRLCIDDDLQRLNGIKNVLAGLANGVAAIYFIAFADPAWGAAGLIAAGSIAGAQVGARYGRRLPQEVLRRIVVVGGTIVAVILFLRAV
jgi:uncharacterized membrane protein YfcA